MSHLFDAFQTGKYVVEKDIRISDWKTDPVLLPLQPSLEDHLVLGVKARQKVVTYIHTLVLWLWLC